MVPAQATFTEGNAIGTTPYWVNNYDPHVPGVIGYVWPGSGECAYLGLPNAVNNNCGPGYQAPYPNGNPPGAPSSSWYQLEGNAYAPFGAVLTGSTGDMIFGINATACADQGFEPDGTGTCAGPHGVFTGAWDVMAIYFPPGFTVPDASQIVTSFTNDYSGIFTVKASPYDRFGPNDTVVYIFADGGQDAPGTAADVGVPYYQHQLIQFTRAGEWYYVRINGVTAPTTAGKYFFKIYLESGLGSGELGGQEGVNQETCDSAVAPGTLCIESPSQFIPTENWPVLLVKGEIDPAIMTGTIRYAGYNATLYGQPVQEAGRVWAEMTMRLDPYTGLQRPDLPTINAVGYFNATAQGHYEVEGLAPGIYDLYASAAGYPQTLCASAVTVLRGQSLHFDCYLQPGPVIHGNVFTKHQFGDEPWPGTDYIKIELYANPTLNNIPATSAGPAVSWSPIPCVAGGQELLGINWYRDAVKCGDPTTAGQIAFPWHEYTPANGYGSPDPVTAAASGFYQVSTEVGTAITQDPMGVGPPQNWYVTGYTTTPFHFEFGVKGEYGAPRDLDGGVPQMYATWVNGLTPGRYYARAWTFRYVQTALDGATFQEYYFDITPNEWAGDVTLPIDLRLSSWVNKTVHFHDTVGTIVDQPIDTGAGFLSGVLEDANGQAWSYNQTQLGYYGYYSHGADSGYNWNPNSYPGLYALTQYWGAPNAVTGATSTYAIGADPTAIETGVATITFYGRHDVTLGEDYGIPSGTYTPHVFALGYIENSPVEQVSVTLSGNPTAVSDHMYRAAGFNITIYSIDWERPTVARNWIWGQWGVGPALVGCTTGACLGPAGEPESMQSGQLPYPWGEGYTVTGGAVGGTGLGACTAPAADPTTPYCGPFSTNPNLPADWAAMVGEPVDVAIYNNGSYINGMSDTAYGYAQADTIPSNCLFQNDTTSFITACGGGWNPQGVTVLGQPYSAASNQNFDSNGAFFGNELIRQGFVGGYTSGSLITLGVIAPFSEFQTSGFAPVPGTVNALYQPGVSNLYASSMPASLPYDFRAYTYGYIQDQDFSAYVASGQVADVRINLVIGVNVTLDVLFKKESIITPTDANMSARVRLFNDQGNLVAEWMSSEGTYVPVSGFATAADGETAYPFGNTGAPFDPTTLSAVPGVPIGGSGTAFVLPNGEVPYPGSTALCPGCGNTYNYLPGGVTKLHFLMAGLPQVPSSGQNGDPSAYWYNKETYFADPILAGIPFAAANYAAPGNPTGTVPGYAAGFFPNAGILGASDYTGGWTAEVDFVPWYANNTATPEAASNVYACTPVGCAQSGSEQPLAYPAGDVGGYTLPVGTPGTPPYPQYYPPVVGLLEGESYHIVPGTTATSGISLTEDLASGVGAGAGWPTAGWSVGHTMAANLLGPYSQEGVWQIAGAHNSGEASAIFEVDLNGFVSGTVTGFTYAGDFRTISWGTVGVTFASGPMSGKPLGSGPTVDGLYGMYLPAGNYQLTFAMPGYAPQTLAYSVTAGQTGTGANIYLEQSQIPVPEFSGVAVVAISALAASVYLLKRRRK